MKKWLKAQIRNYAGDALPPNSGDCEKFFTFLNLLIPILTGLYVFLNPLPLSAASEFCFYLSLAALIVLLIFKKTCFTLRWPLTLPIALFFIWAVFGLFFTLDFKNSLHDLRGHLLEFLIIFYLLVNYFHSQKKLEDLSWIVISSTTIFSVGAVIVFYFIEGFPFNARLGSTFKEMYTGWMCFITIFAVTLTLNNLYKAKSLTGRALLTACLLIMTTTTLLNQSRGALIGLLAALIIMCFSNRKNLIFIIIVVLLILLIPGTKERVSNEGFADIRSKMNRLYIEIIRDYPVTGVGFGMQIYGNKNVLDLEKYNKKLPQKHQQGKIIASPHNTLLDVAVRTGIIGLLLYVYILLCALFMLWQTLRRSGEYFLSWSICLFACFMSFMLQALFADTTFGSRAVVFYTILAMITILWSLGRQKTPEEIAAIH
jgi:O-antigen ligase